MPHENSLSELALSRIRVLYTGRVQGVGFRYATLEISRDHRVTGFVRNLPDGSVELEAQGNPATVKDFLDAVSDHFRGNIRHEHRSPVAPVPPHTSGRHEVFEVRY